MPTPPHINTQINHARVHGNLVVQGDAVIYESGFEAPRLLTAIPHGFGQLIGREADLKRLTQQLQKNRILVINGMGGVGKTALATAYINQQLEQYAHVAWIEQLGDSISSFLTNRSLTNNLQVQLGENPDMDMQLLLNRLGALGGPSLLVIDNAEEDLEKWRNHLPRDNWQIIITSRQQLDVGQLLDLDNLPPVAARELFFSFYDRDQDPEAVQLIIDQLDRHTLSLEILARTSQARRIQPLTKVVELLEERGLEIGRQVGLKIEHSKGEKISRFFPYLQSIFNWSNTTHNELWLLKKLLFLPHHPHSFERLAGLLRIEPNDELWDSFSIALDGLVEKGWIHETAPQNYKLHRVVQGALMTQLLETISFKEVRILVTSIRDAMIVPKQESIVDYFHWLSYGTRILELMPQEWTSDPYVGDLQFSMAFLYRGMGQYAKALELNRSALRTIAAAQPELEEGVVIRFKAGLAQSLEAVGEVQQALNILQEAYLFHLGKSGPDHSNTLISMAHLSSLYQQLGQFEKALELRQKIVAAYTKQLDSNDSLLIESRSNLAETHWKLGQLEAAQTIWETVLEWGREHLAADHPDQAISLSNLALLYSDQAKQSNDQNKQAQAAELLEKALEIEIKNYGLQHPSTSRCQSNLATVYLELSRTKEAIDLLETALATDLQVYGPHSARANRVRINLSSLYSEEGRFQEAIALLQEAIAIEEASFGPNHYRLATCLNNLANAYYKNNDLPQALPLMERALSISEKVLPPDHPDLKNRRANLAIFHSENGDEEKATQDPC